MICQLALVIFKRSLHLEGFETSHSIFIMEPGFYYIFFLQFSVLVCGLADRFSVHFLHLYMNSNGKLVTHTLDQFRESNLMK